MSPVADGVSMPTQSSGSATGGRTCPPAADIRDRRFVCSWSGGKDCYLALQRASTAGGRPAALLSMLREDGTASRGHGLPLALLEAQAAALGLPLVCRSTTWDGYEEAFVNALHEFRRAGVQAAVFGDIDLEGHREWVERVCGVAGLSCHLPLWRESRRRLVDELIACGVQATVVAVDATRLDAGFLGRQLDGALVTDLLAAGVDVCGEDGEYHTMVTRAPLFSRPVALVAKGHRLCDGHWNLIFGPEHQCASSPSSSTSEEEPVP